MALLLYLWWELFVVKASEKVDHIGPINNDAMLTLPKEDSNSAPRHHVACFESVHPSRARLAMTVAEEYESLMVVDHLLLTALVA